MGRNHGNPERLWMYRNSVGNGLSFILWCQRSDNEPNYSLRSIAQRRTYALVNAAGFNEIRSERSDNNNWNGMCIAYFTSIKINLGEILVSFEHRIFGGTGIPNAAPFEQTQYVDIGDVHCLALWYQWVLVQITW